MRWANDGYPPPLDHLSVLICYIGLALGKPLVGDVSGHEAAELIVLIGVKDEPIVVDAAFDLVHHRVVIVLSDHYEPTWVTVEVPCSDGYSALALANPSPYRKVVATWWVAGDLDEGSLIEVDS